MSQPLMFGEMALTLEDVWDIAYRARPAVTAVFARRRDGASDALGRDRR